MFLCKQLFLHSQHHKIRVRNYQSLFNGLLNSMFGCQVKVVFPWIPTCLREAMSLSSQISVDFYLTLKLMTANQRTLQTTVFLDWQISLRAKNGLQFSSTYGAIVREPTQYWVLKIVICSYCCSNCTTRFRTTSKHLETIQERVVHIVQGWF